MTPETADARPDDPSRSWRWIAERVCACDERAHVVLWHPAHNPWPARDLLRLLSGFRAVELLACRVPDDIGRHGG
jgi:hypothetical protein